MTDDRNPEAYKRAQGAVEEVFRIVLQLNGSITGEHGVGLSKKQWLPLQQEKCLIDLQKRIRNAFDPDHLLNPGKIFDV